MFATRAPYLIQFQPSRPTADLVARRPRGLLLGCGLSLVAHTSVIALLAGSSRATTIDARPAGEAAAIALVTLAEAAPDVAPPTEPVAVAPSSPRGRRSPGRRLPAVRQPVTLVAAGDASAALGAGVEPTSRQGPVSEATTATAAAEAAPASQPGRPVLVTPAEGRGLRLVDEYPDLPPALKVVGFTQAVRMQICVSTQGRVDEVRFDSDIPSALQRVLEPAIRRWQYRQFTMGGTAVRFCHPLRIEYRMT